MDRPSSSPPSPPPGRGLILPAIIVSATVVAFLPSLHGEFLNWDDDANFLSNPHYRGLGPENLRWMFTDTFGHYMPLTWLTLGLDYVVWGMRPLGYHATSIALHAINALLLYFVLRRLLRSAVPGGSDGQLDGASAAGALFWSLHPLRVESVAWITERRDTVSGLFFLLSLLLYLRFAVSPPGAGTRWTWLVLSCLSFAAMLLSKTMGLALPFLLLIVDAVPLRRWTRQSAGMLLVEKTPYFLLMAAGLVLLSFTAGKADGVYPRDQYSYWQSLAQPGFRVCFYVGKTLIPVALSPLYWYRPGIGIPQILGGAALVGITTILVLFRRRFPAALAAWVSFGLLIAPASGLVQFGSIFAADRYTYIPGLPIAALVAGAVAVLSRTVKPAGLAGAAAFLLVGLGVLASRQCRIWTDSVALWNRAIELDPEVYLSHHLRGRALAALGQWTPARAEYDRALALNPRWFEIWGARARVRLVQDDAQGAITDATTALGLEPGWSEAHCVRGKALAQLNRPAESEADFSAALVKRPQFVEARVGRATDRALLGNLGGALEDLNAALAFDPQASIYVRRATVRGMGGDLEGAIADLDEAIRRKPDYGDAYARRGMSRLEQNRKPEAAADLERALQLLPPGTPLQSAIQEALRRARAP